MWKINYIISLMILTKATSVRFGIVSAFIISLLLTQGDLWDNKGEIVSLGPFLLHLLSPHKQKSCFFFSPAPRRTVSFCPSEHDEFLQKAAVDFRWFCDAWKWTPPQQSRAVQQEAVDFAALCKHWIHGGAGGGLGLGGSMECPPHLLPPLQAGIRLDGLWEGWLQACPSGSGCHFPSSRWSGRVICTKRVPSSNGGNYLGVGG